MLTSDIRNLVSRLCPKGHSQSFQKRASLFIVARARNNRDVHAAQFVDFVKVDLRKNQLLAHADGVIAAAIKSLWRNTTKVANPRQSNRYQPIEKLIHAIAT